ncbi:broad specificity phosphatase PhoE [Okibacterium sp. HSC-33S16]|uniref:histidine phosphatase family protein n=1 Tax=Okibacterium sp. HSC-33S16 TaxID=2910965 RepID=UPI0020A1AC7B|nr:histidine phosphatase family protein [Okibacterium sp. HSC-33S16]MCP2032092.1 broad specificity phosphatase PhoE [Okibacterium sp. HSC-33S16]
MTSLALVRHGETDWNRERRLQGRADIPLNETGIEQARALAARFDASEWALILSSPLSRAWETARTLSAASGIPLGDPAEELIERSFGSAEGEIVTDAKARWIDSRYPGSETPEEVGERGSRYLTEVARAGIGNVIVVSHGAFIRATVTALTGVDLGGVGNAAIVRLEYSDGTWELANDPVASVTV